MALLILGSCVVFEKQEHDRLSRDKPYDWFPCCYEEPNTIMLHGCLVLVMALLLDDWLPKRTSKE